MSFWIGQKYFVTIGTLDVQKEYLGNHIGFDTLTEAYDFMNDFNSDPAREEDLDVCGTPRLNPYHTTSTPTDMAKLDQRSVAE